MKTAGKVRIILGSSSVFRKESLERILERNKIEISGKIEIMSPNIDEKAIRDENPEEMVKLIASAKLKRILEILTDVDDDSVLSVIITGDQVIDCNGSILEKPSNEVELRKNMSNFVSFSPFTVSGVVVCAPQLGLTFTGVERVKVVYKQIEEEDLKELVKNETPYTCCGGMVVEDPIQKKYITSIEGDLSSVYGMPESIVVPSLEKIFSKWFNK